MKLTSSKQIKRLVYNRKITIDTHLLDRDGMEYTIEDIGMKFIHVSPVFPDDLSEGDYFHDKLTLDDLLNWEVLEWCIYSIQNCTRQHKY